jgi:hypothetical protein
MIQKELLMQWSLVRIQHDPPIKSSPCAKAKGFFIAYGALAGHPLATDHEKKAIYPHPLDVNIHSGGFGEKSPRSDHMNVPKFSTIAPKMPQNSEHEQ